MPETTETVEAVTTETVEDVETGKDGKPFDPERAQATIEKLRAEIKTLKPVATEAERLKQERADAEAAQAEAQRKAAEEQGKFKELYEAETAKVTNSTNELTAAQEKLTRYDSLLAADIDNRIKGWPEEIAALIPSGDSVDALTKMEAISKLEPAAQRLMKAPAPGGNGAGPVASGMPDATDQQRNAVRQRHNIRM